MASLTPLKPSSLSNHYNQMNYEAISSRFLQDVLNMRFFVLCSPIKPEVMKNQAETASSAESLELLTPSEETGGLVTFV